MDVRGWKKILLHWVSECGFLERNYFNIEQTDIEAFYRNFSQVHKAGHRSNLISFLQHHYPDFQPNLDDENGLSSADYIYVYSLLLHFSCVKYPETQFHEICQRLSEQTQICIAGFFKHLLECSVLDRDNLRQAIAGVPAHVSPRHNESLCAGISASPSSFTRQEGSPQKSTPRRLVTPQRISPPTPKTFLLEERTRELYNLKAQLETERYEKGLLEVQIKQNEDKILKLNHDHKKLQQQIQALKNDILTKNTESFPNRTNDEQIKRHLCKEISQKEQEISKLTDILSTLKEEKNLTQEKLVYAEKQINVCMNRIKELDYKVDELTTELEQKNNTIKYLSNSKLELEQFISETRSAASGARPDFNASAECLDASFSRAAYNSSGSMSSPENLGCSVVDLQYREKEHENFQLRNRNMQLAKRIQETALKHAEEHGIDLEIIVTSDHDSVDPEEHFVIFADYVDKLGKRYKDEQNRARQLQEESEAAQQRNEQLNKKIEELVVLNDDLNNTKIDLQERLQRCENEIETLNAQKFELVARLEKVANDFDAYKDTCQTHQSDFGKNVKKMEAVLSTQAEVSTALRQENDDLKTKVQELQKQNSDSDAELKTLNERLRSHEVSEQLVKEKYEKLIILCESMKKDTRETDNHLSSMRNELAVKELEMCKIGNEIVEVRKKNSELEERVNKLMNKHRSAKQTADAIISKKTEHIEELEKERDQMRITLEKMQSEFEHCNMEFRKSKDELQTIFLKVETINSVLNAPMVETNVSASLAQIASRVEELVEHKRVAATKIENLEFDNLENNAQIALAEEKLLQAVKAREEISKSYENQINELKSELSRSQQKIDQTEEKLEKLRDEQTDFIGKLQSDYHEKEKILTERMSQDLKRLGNELKAVKDHYNGKEQELETVSSELAEMKQNLKESEQQLAQLRVESAQLKSTYDEKIHHFESEVQSIESGNKSLVKEIQAFKQEHSKSEERLRAADAALNKLSKELNQENANKSELNLKLKASEVRLQETETKLESILREKSNTINDMQTTYENQMHKLKRSQKHVIELEQVKTAQMEMITSLQMTVQQITEEKERLLKDSAEVSAYIQREQNEKSLLLRSLEKTADQLKMSVDEKAKQAIQLEKFCAELSEKLKEVEENNSKLQRELEAKEAKLRFALDEQIQERDDLQNKLSSMIGKLAKQSEELETHDVALIDILAVLENYTNFKLLEESAEIKNLFSAEDIHDNGDNEHKSDDSQLNELRKALNFMVYTLQDLRAKADAAELKGKEAVEYVDVLSKANGKLNSQITRHKAEISELQELLSGEARSLESKLKNEVKRLSEDIQNIEAVNEKLTNENAALQLKVTTLEEETANAKRRVNFVNEEYLKLTEEQKHNAEIMKQEQNAFNEQLKEKDVEMAALESKCSNLEQLLNELNESHTRLTDNEREMQAKLKELHEELHQNQVALAEQTEKNNTLQKANKTTDSQLTLKSKQCLSLESKVKELSSVRKQLEEQFKTLSQKLEDTIALKLAAESKYEQVESKFQQMRREYDISNLQHQSTLADVERLTVDVDTLKAEKEQLNNELKDGKRELLRANDNISQLIQQIASIRLEKESVSEESLLLRRQIEERGKFQTSSESKLKFIVERSQSLELKLLSAENELKSIRSNLEKSEVVSEKLVAENKKLHDSQEASTKRIEKLALKLGDAQARSTKLERENDKLTKTIEASNAVVDALQREKETLQQESKALKERVSKAEHVNDQLMVKVQTLEQANDTLKEAKQKLEAADIDAKSKLTKLEKMREANEEKVRKLNNALNNSEQTNVRLNLEIGALNSQLHEVKSAVLTERTEQVEEVTQSLQKAEEQARSFEQISKKLEAEVQELRAQNSDVSDQLSKVSLSLHISTEKCMVLAKEMENLRADIAKLREEKTEVEKEHISTCAKLKESEVLQGRLRAENREVIAPLEIKVSTLQAKLSAKMAEITALQNEVETLRITVKEQHTIAERCSAIAAELESTRTRLSVAEAMLEKEQNTTAQLRLDNEILLAKYRESKQRLVDEGKTSEERIKENRLELEGKLEKMKNKMTQCRMFDLCGTGTKWKSRLNSCFKYFFVILLSQVFFAIILNYVMSKNDLTLIFKSNRPPVF